MNNFIWILCLAVIAHRSEGNIQGLPIRSLSPRLLSARAATTCANIYGPICGDCTTLWTCLGESTAYKIQSCEKSYPGQPYCVDGACSSSSDPNDDECSVTAGITCTGAGYFPNPLNCSQYYFCKGPQGASMAYECPPGFVYNSITKLCKRRVLASDCSTVNCDSNPDRFVAYVANPTYYALCAVTDGITSPIMFRCTDPEQFVQSQRRCTFQCKTEGRVADGKDCMKFYECYRNGLSFIMLRQKCPTGFIFNSEQNGCVEGTCPVAGDGAGTGTDSETGGASDIAG